MKTKVITSTVTVNEAAQVLALCVTMIGRLWVGDQKKILAALQAHYNASL